MALLQSPQSNTSSSSSSSPSSRPMLNKDVKRLVWVWSSMALISILYASYVNYYGELTNSADESTTSSLLHRYLFSASDNTNDPPQHVEQYTFSEEHKSLFPLNAADLNGFFFSIFGLVIAAGGGIGGGGILVPIYILVMKFSPKHAIPLSNITVFGGALANTLLNASKRHPNADRPLVDWDLILIMEPLTIAGALMGAFLNKLLPEELLVFMLVLLLTFTSYTTLKKAIKMYKVESLAMRQRLDGTKESELTVLVKEEEEEDEDEVEESLLDHMEVQDSGMVDTAAATAGTSTVGTSSSSFGDDKEDLTTISVDIDMTGLQNPELKKILQEERTPPMANIKLLVIMFVVVLFINILKGGGAFPSPLGIKCGSQSFWFANLFMLGWIVAVSMIGRSYLLKKYEAKKRCGFQYVEGDIKWDPRATIVYPVICALAGFFAGMFGIGGGIVKGPLMLAMGVHPKVSSASSACMILFTSFTATTSFVVFGLLVPDYAVVCLILGFTATFVGQIVLNHLMNKFQRNSYIAFSIGGVVLLSAFLMTIQSMISLSEGAHHSSGGICGKDK